MSDLAAWLLARIAEDEQAARDASWRSADWSVAERRAVWGEDPGETVLAAGKPVAELPGGGGGALVAEHIARWDPVRVLAECESKRALIAETIATRHLVVAGDCWFTCPAATQEREGETCCNDDRRGDPCDCGRDWKVDRLLRLLALPYAGCDGYDEAWRP